MNVARGLKLRDFVFLFAKVLNVKDRTALYFPNHAVFLFRKRTPKSMTFVIGKMRLVSFSLFLDAFPPKPKMPFGQRHVAMNIYILCKGHGGVERHQFYLSNDKCHNFRCISYACAEGIR